MKTYCFCWYNIASGKREVGFVLAEDEKEAEKIAVLTMIEKTNFDGYTIDHIKHLTEITDNTLHNIDDKKQYKSLKKYCFVWNWGGIPQADFILAENEDKAKKIAVEHINIRTVSNTYTDKDVINIKEITDKCFYTEKDIERIAEALKI